MARTRVNLELAKHCGTERPLWQHTLNGLFHYTGGEASLQLGKGRTFQSAGKLAMPIINLASGLLPVTRIFSALTTTM